MLEWRNDAALRKNFPSPCAYGNIIFSMTKQPYLLFKRSPFQLNKFGTCQLLPVKRQLAYLRLNFHKYFLKKLKLFKFNRPYWDLNPKIQVGKART